MEVTLRKGTLHYDEEPVDISRHRTRAPVCLPLRFDLGSLHFPFIGGGPPREGKYSDPSGTRVPHE